MDLGGGDSSKKPPPAKVASTPAALAADIKRLQGLALAVKRAGNAPKAMGYLTSRPTRHSRSD